MDAIHALALTGKVPAPREHAGANHVTSLLGEVNCQEHRQGSSKADKENSGECKQRMMSQITASFREIEGNWSQLSSTSFSTIAYLIVLETYIAVQTSDLLVWEPPLLMGCLPLRSCIVVLVFLLCVSCGYLDVMYGNHFVKVLDLIGF